MPYSDPAAKKANDHRYYLAHKEEHAAQGKIWRENNAESERLRKEARYWGNVEEERAKRRDNYAANKEAYKARSTARYERLKDDPAFKAQLAANQKRQAAIYPERIKAARRKWKQANKERVAEDSARRRVRIRHNGTIEEIDRDILWRRDQGCCYLCGEPANRFDWHLDHKTPVARGGTHIYDNAGVTHPRCNHDKSTMTEAEYRAYLAGAPRADAAIHGRRIKASELAVGE